MSLRAPFEGLLGSCSSFDFILFGICSRAALRFPLDFLAQGFRVDLDTLSIFI